jgi:hypothetical protein
MIREACPHTAAAAVEQLVEQKFKLRGHRRIDQRLVDLPEDIEQTAGQ